ncbi:mitochondrial adenine nucleotide transporter ADNT1 [Nematostella vectensis]|uniref:mitochondrial adenine nucleotide transporter ADNT1 n=1 Tax=Nematostella vectensis TaxID=45351 RepID=UPI00138FBEE6|nr:mitochondrial adenine nucleotide transporter ADNT1 [Nematostella vectensis]
MPLTSKLQDVFNEVDESADHRISWAELQQCCKKLQIELDNDDQSVFHSCEDQQGEGLSFNGFCKFVTLSLEKIFQEIDEDNSGYIDHNEISNALKKLDIHLPSRQIDGILKGMDLNNDNRIDFDEFCAFFSDIPSPNLQLIAKKWSSGVGLDFGSDIAPTSIPPTEMPLVQFMSAGGVAGVASRTLTAPLEKMKIIAQTSSGRSSIANMFTMIWKGEGIRGLFSGNLTNCVRVFPTSAIVCLVYSRMIKYTPVDNDKNPHQPLWRFVSGATAGVVATASTHPLDVVRARLTVQDMSTRSISNYTGIVSALRRIHIEEGIRGLYKGLVPSLVSIAPFLGVQQSVYDIMKLRALDSAFAANSGTFLVCGAIAGMIAQTVVHPLDVVRRQMQVDRGRSGSITQTSLSALKILWKQGGPRRIYAGLTASYLKVMPAAATSLLVRDALLGRLKD